MTFVFCFCVVWIFLCGRMWWSVGRAHPFQRRLIALAAGLGAAAFYYAGAKIHVALERSAAASAKPEPTSENVRVQMKRDPQ
jgi:hypothetical protein